MDLSESKSTLGQFKRTSENTQWKKSNKYMNVVRIAFVRICFGTICNLHLYLLFVGRHSSRIKAKVSKGKELTFVSCKFKAKQRSKGEIFCMKNLTCFELDRTEVNLFTFKFPV